ncbi:kinase-like domain-containing protein [Zopfochytrium polystomum]|nr:kinase-like domain-containing protein [Zopfochytrium polystomum]
MQREYPLYVTNAGPKAYGPGGAMYQNNAPPDFNNYGHASSNNYSTTTVPSKNQPSHQIQSQETPILLAPPVSSPRSRASSSGTSSSVATANTASSPAPLMAPSRYPTSSPYSQQPGNNLYYNQSAAATIPTNAAVQPANSFLTGSTAFSETEIAPPPRIPVNSRQVSNQKDLHQSQARQYPQNLYQPPQGYLVPRDQSPSLPPSAYQQPDPSPQPIHQHPQHSAQISHLRDYQPSPAVYTPSPSPQHWYPPQPSDGKHQQQQQRHLPRSVTNSSSLMNDGGGGANAVHRGSNVHPEGPVVIDRVNWDIAATIFVTSLSGQKVSISQICGEQRTVLIFLRRFECATCSSYFILFGHLRPVLIQSNIRTVFITCHETLTEVELFLKSFAFWLRTLQPSAPSYTADGAPALTGILPGDIYLDVDRESYAFFGIQRTVSKLNLYWKYFRAMIWKALGYSHVGQQKPYKPFLGDTLRDARFFFLAEMQAVLPPRRKGSQNQFQAPGIVVVDRGAILYRHIVISQYEQSQVIPQPTTQLSEALACDINELRDLERVVEKGFAKFLEAVSNRDTSAAVTANELVFREHIGRGVESDVYLCDWTNLKVAVKVYKIASPTAATYFQSSSSDAASLTSFATEAALLMSLRHRNVIQLMGFGCDPPNRPFLVSEFMPRGSLFDVIGDRKLDLTPALKKSILLDAARGVAFLHNCRPPVIHQDLKSLNFLVADDFTCKVADFGIARTLKVTRRRTYLQELRSGGGRSSSASGAALSGADHADDADATGTPAGHKGTLQWMPPEQMLDDTLLGSTKTDVFAFGVVMWEVGVRGRPWKSVPPVEIVRAVTSGARPPVPPGSGEDPFWRLASKCWAQLPTDRPEFSAVVKSLEKIECPP